MKGHSLGVATGHDYLNRGFYEALFSDGVRSVGGAATAGKLNLWTSGTDPDLLDTCLLFGDPATELTVVPAGKLVYLPVILRAAR